MGIFIGPRKEIEQRLRSTSNISFATPVVLPGKGCGGRDGHPEKTHSGHGQGIFGPLGTAEGRENTTALDGMVSTMSDVGPGVGEAGRTPASETAAHLIESAQKCLHHHVNRHHGVRKRGPTE